MTLEAFDPRRDLRRIMEIERDSFGKDAWPADLFREYSREEGARFLVARVGNAIAGYVIAVLSRKNTVEIESLAVHSRFRRQGVASVLFDAVVIYARKVRATAIGLMVRRDNSAAICFYRELGFVRTATVPRYYEDGSAGWRMKLAVPTP